MHSSVLRYFIEVARCGSVRKASERLCVASSAVNRQILKLEEELGTELFDRLPDGLRLNPAGERLLKHARETLHQYQVARAEIDAIKGESTGHIKVASMDPFLDDLVPAVVEEFLQVFPAAKYTIAPAQSLEVPRMVVSGQADIGITYVGRLAAGVTTVAVANCPIGVVMPPGHPLADQPSVTLQECARHRLVRPSMSPVVTAAQAPEFAEFWDGIEPTAVCSSMPVLRRLIMAGLGIGCFSKIAFLSDLRRGDLLWRPLAVAELAQLQVGILVPTQRALPGMTQNFVDRLARRLQQLELGTGVA
ncbi:MULTISPECIES: LysR family transcriptional regulator [Ramlibacter]|uniref:LysR family transcriptional regulator n=1 Tax=Ramlibacter pinisoli TaxID=2682844 RepID=A0A6N8J2M9_9BURK|nr:MULTISPECIES: LysR family transcriptional regulator [Ramlibacter]MBA2962618.1 LysR family transcriptional regulator [Ramlibacter sp. CGMCC 1.13660]MVQ32560.1 LysR family transcriptional regulator [Ramlibacter pinisoli]